MLELVMMKDGGRMRKITNNQNGFVLALTLMCALVLTSVMLTTMFVSTKGQKVSKNLKESVQTLNAADAAIKRAKAALSTWLITQQVGTGTIAEFDAILTASSAAHKLTISGDATDWGNLSLLGSTVSIVAWDDECGAYSATGSCTTDSDRIIKLTATATSASRQRVQIDAYVQAPSDTNTTGMPAVEGAATFCSDALARKQVLRVKESSLMDSYNWGLPPSFACTGTDCATTSTKTGSGDLPPAIMFNSIQQTIAINSGGVVSSYISPTNYIIATTSTNCDQLFAYANQVSLLSDSLPNVNVIAGETVSSASLGTRTNPVVSIFNGATAVTRRGITRTRTVIDANSRGAGIMMIQYDSNTNSDAAAMVVKDNFYFEGAVYVYGDELAGFRAVGSTMYGATILLTGSEDETLKERFALRHGSVYKYSSAALDIADLAMGTASSSTPVTTTNDARNQVITVGWAEVYGGG